jgi:acyl carrier protein|tara:strand:+ start:6878 stop:7126 length:249 start_codon:yes stop_codon:yes gene_type:complete
MKTTEQDFISDLNKFLIEEFEIEGDILPEMSIMEALDLDSLDLIDLVVVIEQKYGVKVEGEDFATIKTMDNFYKHIHKQMAA